MASGRTLVKRYVNQSGLDLKSNDLTRDERFATSMANAQYRKSGTIEKRPGFQAHSNDGERHGLFYYAKVNPTSGADEPEVLSVSDTVEKLSESTLVVTYTGAETNAIVSIFFDVDAGEYKCQITAGVTLVLDLSLGQGFDEASTVTINTLKTQIDALADFTATLTGATSTPAAFCENVIDHDLVAGPLTTVARYWEAVNSPLASMLSGTSTNKNDVDFELPSFVQISNVAFVSNGYDNVLKYDGQNLYRAGLPKPSTPSLNLVAGSITGGPYSYRLQYVQWDAAGNLIEGDLADESATVTPAAKNVEVTVPNILASSGFNTNCAIVNGAQAVVTTITVDAAHTIKVGDTAYFYDAVSASYVEREVTAIGATSITIAGAAVTVADNAVISNNLRIGIYRNKTAIGGIVTWYLVDEIPNNSLAATQVYTDSKADAALGLVLLEPLTDREVPPKGKYISAFRNQMVVAGKLDEPNTFFWSDLESPEYFPALNRQDVNTTSGDTISGLSPNNEVFAVFKKQSIFIVSGDIANGTIRTDQLTSDIGCIAHASIKEIRGVLFFLSDVGPRKMIGGQVPVALGASLDNPLVSRIDPIFEQVSVSDSERWVMKRAVAENDRLKEKYLLFIPCESSDPSGDLYANEFSRVFAYDYSRDSWLEWTNLNFRSGVIVAGLDLYWLEKAYSSYAVDVRCLMYRRHRTGTEFDNQDNTTATVFSYASQWEALGEPSVMKKFLNIRVFSLEDLENNQTDLTIKTEHNYIRDDTKSSFDISFGGGGYGVSSYGENPYGDPTEGAAKHKLNSSRTRSLRVIFENEIDQQNVIISGWELEVAAPFRPGMKS